MKWKFDGDVCPDAKVTAVKCGFPDDGHRNMVRCVQRNVI